jgi:nucleoside-diphosphate-sugar epimerase
MRVLITGCAGYVGSVLTTALAKHEGVAEIVGLDLRPQPDRLRIGKLRWVQADTAGDSWRAALGGHGIDAVIHCAYHTREPYGAEHERQRRWNLDGARNVFEFALGEPSVRRVIQFSTVSIYGARPENSPAAPFTEDTPVVPADYLYSRQKQAVEAILRGLYERSDRSKHAIIIRPASVSGPYGRYVVNRFGGVVSTLRTAAGDPGRPARLVPAVPPRGRPDRDHRDVPDDAARPRTGGVQPRAGGRPQLRRPRGALRQARAAGAAASSACGVRPDLARHARRLHHAARRVADAHLSDRRRRLAPDAGLRLSVRVQLGGGADRGEGRARRRGRFRPPSVQPRPTVLPPVRPPAPRVARRRFVADRSKWR